MEPRKPPKTLHTLDWESILDQVKSLSPNDNSGLVIVVNKGQEDETRSPFLSRKEALDMVTHALEKKRLNLPLYTLQSLFPIRG